MFNFLGAKDPIFIPKFQAMKKIFTSLMFLAGVTAFGQGMQFKTPQFEAGLGVAIRHSEGFTIPRMHVNAINFYGPIGAYLTMEQRNNVTFYDDFNGDGNYTRYILGLNATLPNNVSFYGGLSPFGPYGLTGDGGFGKVRKELGIGYHLAPITLQLGYSRWVGLTAGLIFRFAEKE